jgi:putative peptidoglycan lipid II flippase
LGIVFSNGLVELYASAFHAIPGKFELTVQMTQVMFPFFPLVALAAAMMGILNACGIFFIPAFASALFNLVSIGTGVALVWVLPRYGVQPIVGMAWGVLAGGLIQACSQVPSLWRVGFRFRPGVGFRKFLSSIRGDRHLGQMLTLMLPGLVGLGATQLNVLINSILATRIGVGAVSHLHYAFRLMQFPIGVFGVSLAAATLPRLSEAYVDRDQDQVRSILTEGLESSFAINVPAAFGLAAVSMPLVALLFQYGRFGTQDTLQTAIVLSVYAVGLPAYSGVKVLVPACYAFQRARLAVQASLLSVGVTILLNLILAPLLKTPGLALGTSLAAWVNFGCLCYFLKNEVDFLRLRAIVLKVVVVSVIMGGAVFGIAWGVQAHSGSGWERLLWVIGLGALGVGFVGFFYHLTGLGESLEVGRAAQKIFKKLKKLVYRT